MKKRIVLLSLFFAINVNAITLAPEYKRDLDNIIKITVGKNVETRVLNQTFDQLKEELATSKRKLKSKPDILIAKIRYLIEKTNKIILQTNIPANKLKNLKQRLEGIVERDANSAREHQKLLKPKKGYPKLTTQNIRMIRGIIDQLKARLAYAKAYVKNVSALNKKAKAFLKTLQKKEKQLLAESRLPAKTETEERKKRLEERKKMTPEQRREAMRERARKRMQKTELENEIRELRRKVSIAIPTESKLLRKRLEYLRKIQRLMLRAYPKINLG